MLGWEITWFHSNHGHQIELPGKSEMNSQYICFWTTRINP